MKRILTKGKGKDDNFRTELRIEDGDPELDPEKVGQAGTAPVELSPVSFAGWQRPVLEERFKKRWAGAILQLIRGLFPAAALVMALEERRVKLIKDRKTEHEHNALALEYLLGTRSDQRRIEQLAHREERRVGRYDPRTCRQVIKEMRDEFFLTDIHAIRGTPFAKLFFSNLGQSQLIDFVFTHLGENLPGEGTHAPLTLAEAFAKDFNAVFGSSPSNEKLFHPDEAWNASTIKVLGVQRWKQEHVLALLKIGLIFFPSNGALAALCDPVSGWKQFQRRTVEAGKGQMQKGLAVRLGRQIRFDPDILAIEDEGERQKRVVTQATDRSKKIMRSLERYLKTVE